MSKDCATTTKRVTYVKWEGKEGSQETQHSKNNLEKEKRWRTHTFILQNIKQNYNNQASFVLA